MSLEPSQSAEVAAAEEAIRMLGPRNFHQTLWLPPTDCHDTRLRVTFATTSNFDDTSLPAVLFCGPMFAGRLAAHSFDHFAATEGVRVICVDRPGMGGAMRVPLEIRLKVWLETVPALLEKVNVKHVYLMSHSAGTLYLMYTIYHLRNILQPKAPYVGFVSPWVHTEHSNAMLTSVASVLPKGMMDSWNNLAKFMNNRVEPVTSWSGGIFSSISNLFSSESPTEAETSLTPGELYGTSEEVGKQLEKYRQKMFWLEDTTAANEEVKLLLRKSGSDWGICGNYAEYVKAMSAKEQESLAADSSLGKLTVRVYFADSDVMIGTGGRDYFDKTWSQNVGESIDFHSEILPDTDHDSAILDRKKGALKKLMRDIKTLHEKTT